MTQPTQRGCLASRALGLRAWGLGAQDQEVLPLLRDRAIWTLGADSPDIDWEATWRHRLQELPDSKRAGGRRPEP